MRRRFIYEFKNLVIWLMILLLIITCYCSLDPETTEFEPAPNVCKVLFIGNSLTYFYDMPSMFFELSKAAGQYILVDQSTAGGTTLADHSGSSYTLSKIYELKWDYVVLQGSSYWVAFPDQHSVILPYIRELHDTIKESCPETQVIFFMDWAMKNGVTWGDTTYTYTEFQKMIYDGTLILADSLNMIVAPIGWAWNTVVHERPEIELFEPDFGHPSLKGSYLQACVYFSTIFQDSLAENPYIRSLSEDEAFYFQDVATSTVLDSLELWNIQSSVTDTTSF